MNFIELRASYIVIIIKKNYNKVFKIIDFGYIIGLSDTLANIRIHR